MRIVDLFSGAGGLTFGFYYNLINGQFIRNENEFIFANEFDPSAAKAFRANFPDINLIEGDIRDISNERICELIGENEVDIIIGGHPCQSFSTVGKRVYDDFYSQRRRLDGFLDRIIGRIDGFCLGILTQHAVKALHYFLKVRYDVWYAFFIIF